MTGANTLGQKLATSGATGQSPLGIAGRLGTLGLLKGGSVEQPTTLEESLLAQSANSNNAVNTMTPSTNMPISSNMGTDYTQTPQMSSPLGVSTDQIAQALMKAYAAFYFLKTVFSYIVQFVEKFTSN